MDGKLQARATRLALSDIRFEPQAWPRLAHDPDRVAEFASLYEEGGESALPPIETVGDSNLLSDGLHRRLAADVAGLTSLFAVRVAVPEGTDEITFAFLRGVKASTGGHRELTRSERRHGIRRLVEETELSDAEIAKLFGVSRQTVWRIRTPDVANATGAEDSGETYLGEVATAEAAARLFRGLERVYETRGLGFWDAITRDHTGDRLARVLEEVYATDALDRAERFLGWFEKAVEYLDGRRS